MNDCKDTWTNELIDQETDTRKSKRNIMHTCIRTIIQVNRDCHMHVDVDSFKACRYLIAISDLVAMSNVPKGVMKDIYITSDGELMARIGSKCYQYDFDDRAWGFMWVDNAKSKDIMGLQKYDAEVACQTMMKAAMGALNESSGPCMHSLHWKAIGNVKAKAKGNVKAKGNKPMHVPMKAAKAKAKAKGKKPTMAMKAMKKA